VYFWDFVWLEDGIRDAAECCADVESEDERTVIAAVRFPGVGGDGHQGRPPDGVTEGKGEEREEIESKRGVKSNAYTHNEADRSLSRTDLRPMIRPTGSGQRHWLLPPGLARTDGVRIPSFFFTSLYSRDR
jgi:hypothetical protein